MKRDCKVWGGRVKGRMQQKSSKVPITKEVETEVASTDYIQGVIHKVVVELYIRELDEQGSRRVHH